MHFYRADPALIEEGRIIAAGLGERALGDYERFIEKGVPDADYYWAFLNEYPALQDIITAILISHNRRAEV